MNALARILEPLSQRARQHRAANIAAAREHVAQEMRYWTEQAKVATANSDRWHECMDELDAVQALMRCT